MPRYVFLADHTNNIISNILLKIVAQLKLRSSAEITKRSITQTYQYEILVSEKCQYKKLDRIELFCFNKETEIGRKENKHN